MSDHRGGGDNKAQTAGETMPLIEEELRLEKRLISTGKVRIRRVVDTVEEVAQAALQEQKVEIVRVPVGKIVESVPEIRTENGVVIIPVLEETLVIEKKLVLKEELHVHRRVETEVAETPVTLRKQRAVVEREIAEGHLIKDEEAQP